MTAEPLSPEIALALAYAPARHRAALALLWRIDARLAGVRMATPAIAEIKYAWWREALARLDHAPSPPEPLLAETAEHLIRQLRGEDIGEMAMGWSALIEPEDIGGALAQHATECGARLFRLSAMLLDQPGEPWLLRAGEGWALARIADTWPEAQALAAERLTDFGATPWPKPLRPIGMLAALARRDVLAPGGRAGRLGRMLWHRVSGR